MAVWIYIHAYLKRFEVATKTGLFSYVTDT